MSVIDYDFLFKIIEVGESRTGRRSLFIRYTQNYFKDDYLTSIKEEKIIKKIEIDNKLIKCIIYWPYTSPQHFRRFDLILLKLLKI